MDESIYAHHDANRYNNTVNIKYRLLEIHPDNQTKQYEYKCSKSLVPEFVELVVC